MIDLSEVTGVVLAGGLGTRLRSTIGDVPKVLAPIDGRPFLIFLLERMAEQGLRRAIVCTGHAAERVQAEVGPRVASLDVVYVRETTPLGTAGAIRHAWPLLASEWALVINGDSYCNASLRNFVAWSDSVHASAAIVLVRTKETARFGQVLIDENGRVQRFAEKRSEAVSPWINAGIYLLAKHRIEQIPADRPHSIETEVFPSWLDAGIWGYRSDAELVDIGTPDSYAAAEQRLAAMELAT